MILRTMIVSASFLALVHATPAKAGFDWAPPASPSTSAPVPAQDAGEPMPPVDAGMPATPTPVVVRDALTDISVAPEAPAPIISNEPNVIVSEPQIAPTVPRIETPAPAKQDRQTAVYPPPYNAPAAPLARNSAMAIPSQAAEKIIWNEERAPAPAGVTIEPMPAVPASPSSLEVIKSEDPAPAAITAVQAPATYAVVDGFGKGIPLSLALEQVVPKEFKLVYDAQPDMNAIVSWAGGRPWNVVLADMIYAHGYRAVINGKEVKIVSATKLSALPQKTAPAVPVIKEADIAPAAASDEPVVKLAPTFEPTPPAAATGYDAAKVQVFSAHAGDTLQDVLAKWADQANVQLYWQADKNFTLKNAVAFNATFSRAVEQLLNVFDGQSGRPVAKLHPNAPQGPAVLSIASAG